MAKKWYEDGYKDERDMDVYELLKDRLDDQDSVYRFDSTAIWCIIIGLAVSACLMYLISFF